MKECLIVDDSKTMRKMIVQIMEELGFYCHEAENGAVAQGYCEHRMPDLIMLDWNMPVMNGIDFLQILRRMKNGGEPVVIFCTTEIDHHFIERALQMGGDEYIMKPFDKDIVATKLSQLGILDKRAS